MKTMYLIPLLLSSFLSYAQENTNEGPVPREIDELIQTYNFEKALVMLNGLNDSMSVEVLQRKGHCYAQLGNYNDAVNEYQNILGIDSLNVRALMALGQLFGKQKQYGGAFICYTKLIGVDSLNSYYYKQFGIVANNAGIPGVAVANFFKALVLNPRDIESTTLLAEILIDSDHPEIADSLLTKAIEISPSVNLRVMLAKAQYNEKKYKQVIHTVNQLLIEGDTSAQAVRHMAVSYYKLDKNEECIRWLNYMMSRSWKAEIIFYYLGMAYQNLNKQDSAIFYLNRAIDEGITDNIGIYYTQLATSYEAVNSLKTAIKYYKMAYDESKSGILLYHLARNYDRVYEDKTQAIRYFRRYLESEDTIRLAREYSRLRANELEFYLKKEPGAIERE